MITGTTSLWAILADPIHHVQTPQSLNPILEARGVDGVLVPMHVAPAGLAGLVAGLRWTKNLKGFIVTVPHKTAMLALCDEVSESARAIGAVNAVRREPDGRLVGSMLDGAGFVSGLIDAGIDPAGRSVYLVGAGGAANAIAFALADAKVARLTLANRTLAKSHDLAARLARHAPDLDIAIGTADASGNDIVVNATSLGLHEGDALPLDVDTLDPRQIVAEIIMKPEITPLLAAARARGCRIHLGRPMLTSQLQLMADFMDMR